MFPIDRYTNHLANDRSDRIYIATPAGLVMCLHEQGREFASFHVHPDRQPIMPELAPEGATGAGDTAEEPGDMEADGEKPEGDMPADEGDKPDAEKSDEEMPRRSYQDGGQERGPAGRSDIPFGPRKQLYLCRIRRGARGPGNQAVCGTHGNLEGYSGDCVEVQGDYS